MTLDDDAAIAAVVMQFLAGVSFEEGSHPDYSVLRPLFVEGARLVRTSGDGPESWTVDDFISSREEQVRSGSLTAFCEREVAHTTEIFGNTAHRFSTYSKRSVLGGKRLEVEGMISTQLVHTPQGWRISSMAWDDERPGLSIQGHHRSSGVVQR